MGPRHRPPSKACRGRHPSIKRKKSSDKSQSPFAKLLAEHPELNPTYLKLRDEKPLTARLVWAALTRSVQASDVVEARSKDWPYTFHQLASEFYEIATWLSAPPPRESQQEALQSAEELTSRAGWTFSQGLEYFNIRKKHPRGRPVTNRRALAVEALEMKLAKPKLSWTTIAGKICLCGRDKDKHNWDCRERIRQQVLLLEKMLKKYKI